MKKKTTFFVFLSIIVFLGFFIFFFGRDVFFLIREEYFRGEKDYSSGKYPGKIIWKKKIIPPC